MNRIVLAMCSSALLVGSLAGPAHADPGQGASKESLIGPYANLLCSDFTELDTDVSQTVGFVVFNTADSKIMAQVVLQGGAPNTEYPVRLIQAGGSGPSDCLVVDGVIKTNRNGRGTIHLSEPITGDKAQLFINTEVAPAGQPTYRASDLFQTS